MKIIHVGLPKTGTNSLKTALWQYGLTVTHDNGGLYDFDLLAHNDCVVDLPGSVHYQILDRLYPGAVFILTTRNDTAVWLRSCEAWWAKYHGPHLSAHEKWGLTRLLGGWDFDAERLLQERDRHEQEVREYFRDRSRFLVEIELSMPDADKWTNLARGVLTAFRERPLAAVAKEQPWPKKNCYASLLGQKQRWAAAG